MAGKTRKKRFSVVTSLLAATAVFPITCIMVFQIARAVAAVVTEGLRVADIPVAHVADAIVLIIIVGLPLLIAYLAARMTYDAMRWETIDDPEGRFCAACGYDLTGNVSGRCPECGTTQQLEGRT